MLKGIVFDFEAHEQGGQNDEKLMASAIRANSGTSSYASTRQNLGPKDNLSSINLDLTVFKAGSLSANSSGTKVTNKNPRRRPNKWTRHSQQRKSMMVYKEKKREEKRIQLLQQEKPLMRLSYHLKSPSDVRMRQFRMRNR